MSSPDIDRDGGKLCWPAIVCCSFSGPQFVQTRCAVVEPGHMGLDALFCTWRYFCRCHMEESEQQAAGLSALADPAPVVSLGTMPGQDFSTLP